MSAWWLQARQKNKGGARRWWWGGWKRLRFQGFQVCVRAPCVPSNCAVWLHRRALQHSVTVNLAGLNLAAVNLATVNSQPP